MELISQRISRTELRPKTGNNLTLDVLETGFTYDCSLTLSIHLNASPCKQREVTNIEIVDKNEVAELLKKLTMIP